MAKRNGDADATYGRGNHSGASICPNCPRHKPTADVSVTIRPVFPLQPKPPAQIETAGIILDSVPFLPAEPYWQAEPTPSPGIEDIGTTAKEVKKMAAQKPDPNNPIPTPGNPNPEPARPQPPPDRPAPEPPGVPPPSPDPGPLPEDEPVQIPPTSPPEVPSEPSFPAPTSSTNWQSPKSFGDRAISLGGCVVTGFYWNHSAGQSIDNG
jgi:hypothetical protein